MPRARSSAASATTNSEAFLSLLLSLSPGATQQQKHRARLKSSQLLQLVLRDCCDGNLRERFHRRNERACFDLFDDNRRVEIWRDGVYRLRMFVEAPAAASTLSLSSSRSASTATLVLEVNGKPTHFKTTDGRPGSPLVTHWEIPVSTNNVTLVRLRQWDIVSIRIHASSSDTAEGFTCGRFVIESTQIGK